MKENLLTLATADGDGDVLDWFGGIAYLDLNGTIDGATVTVYVNIGGGYNTNIVDLAMTELGLYETPNLPQGALIKATVSSAGASTSLTLIIAG